MKLPPYPKDGVRIGPLVEFVNDAQPPRLAALDQVAALPCPDVEYAIATGGPLPYLPAEVPGIARLKRLRTKTVYRARRTNDEVFRQNESDRTAKWRKACPEKRREQKRRARDVDYNRPFVAIDAEGMNYPGNDIIHSDGILYRDHATYLWGAAADDGRPPVWLKDPESCGIDKRPLGSIEILDWLLSLPEQFNNNAIFVGFSLGYDITQILRNLPYPVAWEIVKRERYPGPRWKRSEASAGTAASPSTGEDRGEGDHVRGAGAPASSAAPTAQKGLSIGHAPVFYKDYAISYFKGKFLRLWRLANPDKPYGGDGKINACQFINIYDTFGFFQTSFSSIVNDMVNNGKATQPEADFIRVMKGKRDTFDTVAIEEIQAYTTLELRLLARQMAELRAGFNNMGLRLSGWHGAGAAASALIKRERFRDHFGEVIAAGDITPQQEAAHHAYFGGRIEMLKQGYTEAGLHVYDIASAYPAAMVEFPSLAYGQWSRRGPSDLPKQRLTELRAAIEATSIFSMFKVRFEFPMIEKLARNVSLSTFVPFFPFPYRDKRGGIIFPAKGYGWYMRDDVLAAIAWMERFTPEFPAIPKAMKNAGAAMVRLSSTGPDADHSTDTVRKAGARLAFEIEGAWIFDSVPAVSFPAAEPAPAGGNDPAPGFVPGVDEEDAPPPATVLRDHDELDDAIFNAMDEAATTDIGEVYIKMERAAGRYVRDTVKASSRELQRKLKMEATADRPLAIIRDLYNERRRIKEEAARTKKYDVREKAIKLSINSVYGKFAQNVGTEGKVPPTANPYYAAATTAYCRRRLIEAALIDPHAVVFLATDGIVTTRPLHGPDVAHSLERVKCEGDRIDLGDWEYCEAESGLFVYAGLYTYGKIKYEKDGKRKLVPVTKTRGANPERFQREVKAGTWLINNIVPLWRKPYKPDEPACLERPFKKYITVGNALASPDRWKIAGRWTPEPKEPGAGTRKLNIDSVGNKRRIIRSRITDYWSTDTFEAYRTRELIATVPEQNDDDELSRARMPEWLYDDIGDAVEEGEEQEAIKDGFR